MRLAYEKIERDQAAGYYDAPAYPKCGDVFRQMSRSEPAQHRTGQQNTCFGPRYQAVHYKDDDGAQ